MNWFDATAWYPLGRIVGGTVRMWSAQCTHSLSGSFQVFPGLMITSGSIHYGLSLINFPVHIREICVFLAPIFSGLTAIATYFLTKEIWSAGAGLFAACFIAIAPGYTSRSVAGSYDNEGIAIFALQVCFIYKLFRSICCFLVYILPLATLRTNGLSDVGHLHGPLVFLHGLCMGRLCFHCKQQMRACLLIYCICEFQINLIPL